MSSYIAPVKDMNFVLNELTDLTEVCQLPYFEDVSEDLVETIVEEAAKFATGVFDAVNEQGDLNGARCEDKSVQEATGFADAYQQFIDGGWSALPCNPEFGGMGLPDTVGMTVMEMWNGANAALALCPMLAQGAIGAIEDHASDAMKELYLEKMIAGQWTGTMNLTEPQAGSDLAVVRTKATPDGDCFRIKGTKIFITWGDHQMTENVIHLVLARLPDAPEGVRGISLFVVPKFLLNDDGSLGERNDVYAVSVEHKLGIHGSPTCVMSFGDNDGAIGYMVGEPNKGLAYMFTMMNHTRLNVGVQGVALADRAYQLAAAYAKDRVQGQAVGDKTKGSIIRHPDVRRMLMTMRALTEAGRALCYVSASAFDLAKHSGDGDVARAANARGEFLTPLAKAWSTEVSQEVTSLGIQVHGGMGFMEETGAAQIMRDTRITTIYEGTSGIQANDLMGRKLIRDEGLELKNLLADVQLTLTETRAAGDDFAVIASSLEEAIASVESFSSWFFENYKDNTQLSGAVAFNFLMACGTLAAGWLMAKSALVAKQKVSEDQKFYGSKIITARFFAEQIMPRTAMYISAARCGSDTIMAMEDDDF